MLNLTSLTNSIRSVLESNPATGADAARGIANAYAGYAGGGTFGASTLVSTEPLRSALESQLTTGFASQSGATVALAFSTALSTGWVGLPVVGAQTGATVGCPGAAGVTATLTALFISQPPTHQLAAEGIAGALHTATLTVTAAVAPPPGTVLPIL